MTATLLALLAADGSLQLAMTRSAGGCRWRLAQHPAPYGSSSRTPPGCRGWRRTWACRPGGHRQPLCGVRRRAGRGGTAAGYAAAAPGAPVQYSNFGYQLLRLVARAGERTPVRAVAHRPKLLTPLGMSRSLASAAATYRRAHPASRPRPPWRLPHWDQSAGRGRGRPRRQSVTWPGTPAPAPAPAAEPARRRHHRGADSAAAPGRGRAGTRPWPGVSATTGIRWHTGSTGGFSASACSSTRSATARSRCWPAALAAVSRCAEERGC